MKNPLSRYLRVRGWTTINRLARATFCKQIKIKVNPKIDQYLSQAGKWKNELAMLRDIVVETGLTEELKWGAPCYTFEKSNVIILGEFKDCVVLSFFKGALLKDTRGILVKPGENTQSARIVRFTNIREIEKLKPVLKTYIREAIEVEKSGLKVNLKEKTALVFPEEFKQILDKNAVLKKAFNALTPGRQRAYNLYFSAPKQSKTRESRIEKYMKQILEGKGLNDR